MKCPDCGKENIEGSQDCDFCHAHLAHEPVPQEGMAKRILEGTVSSLSPKPAIWSAPSDSLDSAVEKMRSNKAGCVLVLESGKLVGVLSEWELLMKAPDGALTGRAVKDMMRSDKTYLNEGAGVAFAFNQFALSGYRHLPVRMKDGSYGVVSARDLLHYLCQ
jgi:predicted transcriptional regulator